MGRMLWVIISFILGSCTFRAVHSQVENSYGFLDKVPVQIGKLQLHSHAPQRELVRTMSRRMWKTGGHFESTTYFLRFRSAAAKSMIIVDYTLFFLSPSICDGKLSSISGDIVQVDVIRWPNIAFWSISSIPIRIRAVPLIDRNTGFT